MKAVLYARISPGRGESKSISHQIAVTHSWCEREGYTIVGEYQDHKRSGGDRGRPGLAEAVERVKKEGAIILTYTLSRLTRNTEYGLKLNRIIRAAGGAIATVDDGVFDTSTPTGMMRFTIQLAFDQFTLGSIGKTASDNMHHGQRNGRSQGGNKHQQCFGYRLLSDKTTDPDPREIVGLAMIKRWCDEGVKVHQVCRRLTEQWGPNRNGNCWTDGSINHIVQREIKYGWLIHGTDEPIEDYIERMGLGE